MKLADIEPGVHYADVTDCKTIPRRVKALGLEHHERTGEYGNGRPATLVRVRVLFSDGNEGPDRREALVRPNALRCTWAYHEAQEAAEAAEAAAIFERRDEIERALTGAGYRHAWPHVDTDTGAISVTLRGEDLERFLGGLADS